MNELFNFLGQIVVIGGGGATIAYFIFKVLGEKWIENKFALNLESYRAIQAQSLEEAKLKLSIYMTRQLKLHEKEYEVFPLVWEKLNEAHICLKRATGVFREHPDLDRMDESTLKKWIDRTDMSENEKDMIFESNDRNRSYSDILDWRDLQRAHTAFVDFHEYLEKNRIFLSPELKEKFDQIDSFIWRAWVAKKMDTKRSNTDKDYLMEAWDIEEKSITPLRLEIEKLVQDKLFPKIS